MDDAFSSSPNLNEAEVRERAMRVRLLRDLTGLSRREFQKHCGISSGTMQHWEEGDFGMSVEGAQRLTKALSIVGIFTSPDWILFGVGNFPACPSRLKANYSIPTPDEFSYQSQNKNSVLEELAVFKKNHPNALELWINDNAMGPFYKIGDLVAGCRLYDCDIEKAIGQDCIVLTESQERLLRHVEKGSLLNTYTLIAISPEVSITKKIIKDIRLISATPVIFIRRSS